ncbi:TRAP transporter small permease subunit [Pontibacterium sp. N1Y112]|uniref:TRAP transporter small permease protein n=1 Tax=Pontibacterium sinense TaxID=2781979 RepID=A0A8J7FDD1_9GAMM|nr:TRAP transporter small permease subunit [Pontibacterium sinense]MBE9397644.1 TRAP transporter small permease subunit [Pontibacterium sinense]
MHLNIPHPLHRLVNVLLRLKEYFLAAASLVMAFVFFFVVILRYWFEADLFAYEEWVLMIAFWVYFLGGAMGSYENTHVKADFLLSVIDSVRTKWIVVNFTILLETLIGCVLTYWGWLMLEEEISAYPDWQRTTGLELPFFIPKLGIFLGFVLMTFYTALHLYSGLRDGPSEEWESDEAPPHI